MLTHIRSYRQKLAYLGLGFGLCAGFAMTLTAVTMTSVTVKSARADELAATMWPSEDAQTQSAETSQADQAPAPAASQAMGAQLAYQSDAMSQDQDAPLEMKQSVVVDAPVIRLGDLFNQPVSGGDTPVAQAPKPGQTISLDSRFLSQLARAYHLEVSPRSKVDRILVARKAQLIKAEAVSAAITEAIQQRSQQPGDMDIALDGGQVQFTLPTGVEASVGIQGLNFDPASNRFVAILVVPANGPTLISQQVVGTVYPKTDVPVLKRLVSAGDTVQADDVEWISSRLDQLAPSTATDAQQLIGRVAKRPLRAGQMVRLTDLSSEATMRKNTLITIAVVTGQMSLTVRGKALEDGAIGQSIRVLNTNSNKQLIGVVKDAATVVIPMVGNVAMN